MYHFEHRRDEIKTWLFELRKKASLPFYGSFDIRDAGWKASVVDANAFPAGFNNIDPQDYPVLASGFSDYLHSVNSNGGRIYWPEAHTRNDAYLENVFVLNNLLIRWNHSPCRADEPPPMDVEVQGGILQLSQVDVKEGCPSRWFSNRYYPAQF